MYRRDNKFFINYGLYMFFLGVFIEDEETQCKNNRSFPFPSPNIVTMVVSQLCECRCVDERNTWLSVCGLSSWTATALKSPACVILCFLFYLILFSSFLFLFLFIYLQVSSLYLFLFSLYFYFLQNWTKFCRPWTFLPLFAFSLEHAFRLADLWPPVLADANTV